MTPVCIYCNGEAYRSSGGLAFCSLDCERTYFDALARGGQA